MTQAMFMNCDHSMLTYRFYRQPEAILKLFKARLKTLVKINLIPALVLACGLPFLLFVTGGTDNPLNYALLFVSILAMAVFFSVHHLVLYYLLQPYNVHMESKKRHVFSGKYADICGMLPLYPVKSAHICLCKPDHYILSHLYYFSAYTSLQVCAAAV